MILNFFHGLNSEKIRKSLLGFAGHIRILISKIFQYGINNLDLLQQECVRVNEVLNKYDRPKSNSPTLICEGFSRDLPYPINGILLVGQIAERNQIVLEFLDQILVFQLFLLKIDVELEDGLEVVEEIGSDFFF